VACGNPAKRCLTPKFFFQSFTLNNNQILELKTSSLKLKLRAALPAADPKQNTIVGTAALNLEKINISTQKQEEKSTDNDREVRYSRLLSGCTELHKINIIQNTLEGENKNTTSFKSY